MKLLVILFLLRLYGRINIYSCHNITSQYNIKYKYCHKIIFSAAEKRKKTFSDKS